jgi:thiamine-monophosphate kinase
MGPPLTIQDIGEQGLLSRLQTFCPAEIVGDDAAVLTPVSGQSLVVTTDVLIDDVHFSQRTTPPAAAGWRAAAANLSDLAAMGATPIGITVGLGLPPTTPVAWVEALYQGMVNCLQPHGTAIVGGDICRSPTRTIAITALGQVAPDRVMRRSTAQPGDAILVTGYHGSARAGLALLLQPESGQGLAEPDRAALIQAHQYPQPRLDVIAQLHEIWANPMSPSPSSPFPIAGMDSSDGLADAVLQIGRASRVGAVINRDQIPIHPALQQWQSSPKALHWALYGGEDFELVLCLPLDLAQRLVEQLAPGAAIVGTITADRTVRLRDRTGSYPDDMLTLDQGFQHFSSGQCYHQNSGANPPDQTNPPN